MEDQYGYWLQGYYEEPFVNFITGESTTKTTEICIAFRSMKELNGWADKYNVQNKKVEPCFIMRKEED